jgi:hypothetical protein
MSELLKPKDRVYYTGDMANASAWCTVLKVNKTKEGRVYYDLLRTEEKDVIRGVFDSHIGRQYFGHCNPRFVTGDAYNTYYAKTPA